MPKAIRILALQPGTADKKFVGPSTLLYEKSFQLRIGFTLWTRSTSVPHRFQIFTQMSECFATHYAIGIALANKTVPISLLSKYMGYGGANQDGDNVPRCSVDEGYAANVYKKEDKIIEMKLDCCVFLWKLQLP
jgi:hypothetical protein